MMRRDLAAVQQRLLELYLGSEDDSVTPVNEPSALLGLPQELLEEIVSHLNFSDAACLTLSTRILCYKLGTIRWNRLRLGCEHTGSEVLKDQRKRFLECLVRDSPKYFLCYTCWKLHLVSEVGPALINATVGTFARPKCVSHPRKQRLPRHSFDTYIGKSLYHLTFQHVQLAMEHHWKGPGYGIPLEYLATLQYRISRRDSVSTLLRVEPKIVNDELLLRVQQWIVFDPHAGFDFKQFRGPNICTHFNRLTSIPCNLMRCRLHQERGTCCPKCKRFLKCFKCETDVQMDMRQFQDQRQAVVITKWMNMGSGHSPQDPKWQQHLSKDSRRYGAVSWKFDRAAFPKSRFEGDEDALQEDMYEATMRDSVSLLSDKTLEEKVRLSGGIWILPQKG